MDWITWKGAKQRLCAWLCQRDETNTEVFQHLLDAIISVTFGDLEAFEAATWHFDFEVAAVNACQRCFLVSVVLGYFFHYTQTLMKAKDTEGLCEAYNATEPDPRTPTCLSMTSKVVWCATTTVLVTRSSCTRR